MALSTYYMDSKEYGEASRLFERLIIDLPGSRYGTEALYWLAYCRYRFGSFEDAREMLKSVLNNNRVKISLKAKARVLLDRIDAITEGGKEVVIDSGNGGGEDIAIGARKAGLAGENLAIGVALPLSGNYKAFGEKALRGILLAARVFGPGPKTVEVVVRDTAESAG